MMRWGYDAWNSSRSVDQTCLAHFGIEEIVKCGYDATELRDAGFSAVDLRKHLSLTAKELKEGGFSREELKAAGFNPNKIL